MMPETTVSRAILEQVAAGFHDLSTLRLQQHATMAEMIRGCVAKLQEELPAFPGARRTEVAHEKRMALIHLQWLATQLENEGRGVDLAFRPDMIVAQ